VTFVAASRIAAGTFSLSTIAARFGGVATIRGCGVSPCGR
jgi:hypothetical protein